MSDQASEYIGLTKKAAQDKSERQNLIFRLIRIDDRQFLSVPVDVRTDRICIEVDDGVVTKATIQ